MSVEKHVLNDGRIALIKKVLTNRAQKGTPAYYEIRVDKITAVQRTNEIDKFDGYKEFYSEETTQEVSILIYEGQSRNNTHHLFIRQEKGVQEQQWHPYSKLSPEEVIQERIAHEKRLWEYQQVQQENLSLKKEIEKLKSGKEDLKDTIGDLEYKIRSGDRNWGNVISFGFEAMVKRNIPLIAKIPGGEGIAEFLQKETQEQQTQYVRPSRKVKAESEVHVEPTETSENSGIADLLTKEFDKEKLKTVSEILVMLAKEPKAIEATKTFLQKPTVKQQLNSILKTLTKKVADWYQTGKGWVKQKSKLIMFYVECLKYLIRTR